MILNSKIKLNVVETAKKNCVKRSNYLCLIFEEIIIFSRCLKKYTEAKFAL